MAPRRDAARNRELLVQAARDVFAARGLGATLDDVAAAAGVGTGTAYRHFRNKHELAAEVLRDATQQIVIDADDALAIDDPWQALVAFFETTAARQAADRGLYQALAGQGSADDKVRIWPQIVAAVNDLFARARDAGVIRADAEAEDAVVIFAMLGAGVGPRVGRVAPLPRRAARRPAGHRSAAAAGAGACVRVARRRHRGEQAPRRRRRRR